MSIKKNKTYRRTRYLLYKETLVDFKEHFWSFIGAFIGIGALSFLHYNIFSKNDLILLIGSFGATAVLIYGNIGSPLSQPRNLFFGHIISALIGVTCFKIFGTSYIWIAAPLAVATSIITMQIAKSLHPPGGATALIAVAGGDSITNLGYLYVLFPVTTGVIILFIVALLFNNITSNRQYPSRKNSFIYKRKKSNQKM